MKICSQKRLSVNLVLENLHSPTHVSSEGLLQYSIGNYTSTASQKSSFTEPNNSQILNYLADLNKNQNFILELYERRQLAHSMKKFSIFLYIHHLAARYCEAIILNSTLQSILKSCLRYEQFTDISLTWISCDDVEKPNPTWNTRHNEQSNWSNMYNFFF